MMFSAETKIGPPRDFWERAPDLSLKAFADAQNRVAIRARDTLRGELPRHFTVRTNWVQRRIEVEKARADRLTALVGSRDAFMAPHTTRGGKESQRGQYVAVPVEARPTITATTPPNKWPRALIAKGGTFWRVLKSGNLGLFRNINGRAALMYVLTPSVRIQKDWPFEATIARVMSQHWDREFERALLRHVRV